MWLAHLAASACCQGYRFCDSVFTQPITRLKWRKVPSLTQERHGYLLSKLSDGELTMHYSSQENKPWLSPRSILFENCNALSILHHGCHVKTLYCGETDWWMGQHQPWTLPLCTWVKLLWSPLTRKKEKLQNQKLWKNLFGWHRLWEFCNCKIWMQSTRTCSLGKLHLETIQNQ